jgi:c-di-GMP-related signal transduction protein
MYIARQPIFKTNLEVYGYELLYRADERSKGFDGTNASKATAVVLGGLFESGIDRIVEDKKAFINVDEDFVHSGLIELIDPDRLVVELLEDIQIDTSLMDRLTVLKGKGYRLALDDFVEAYTDYPLVPMADIIKYDLMATPLDQIRSEVKQALLENKVLLAEKIETESEFIAAKDMGFHLFQGYFFSKPCVVGKSCDKTSSKAQYGRLLAELRKEEPSYQMLAEIIEKDAQLAYRLMRVISSRSGEDLVYSIKRALTYMGLKEIERWINILMLQDLGSDKPKELIRLALIRARFSEAIAMRSAAKKIRYEASLMGLFSVLDGLLDRPMIEALEGISLPQSITDALVSETGELASLYDLLIAYENGQWDNAAVLAQQVKIEEEVLYQEYLNAIHWAKDIFEAIYPAAG